MSRTVSQLPRGRHGLPREEVLASQRERMLRAMTEAVAERGYAKATVADVIRGAGVSRETFYEQFRDKEDCFLAALDGASALIAQRMGAAFTAGDAGAADDPMERLGLVLGAYLETLAVERAAARTFLIEVYGAGPQALNRRVEVMGRFVDLVVGFVGARDDAERRFACEAFVGAISSMVTMRVAQDDLDALPALHAPLMDFARTLLGANR